MKTNFLFFIFFSVLLSTNAFGQLSIGFGGGYVMSGVESYQISQGGSSLLPSQTTYDRGEGFQFSIPVQYKFSNHFSLQSELSYMRHAYSSKMRMSNPDQFIQLFEQETLYRNNIWYGSLLARVSTGGSAVSLHLIAGPSYGWLTSGNAELSQSSVYIDGSMDDFSMGRSYDIADSEFNNSLFGITYGGGLTFSLPHYDVVLEARQFKAFKDMRIDENIRMSNWSLNASVLFPIR